MVFFVCFDRCVKPTVKTDDRCPYALRTITVWVSLFVRDDLMCFFIISCSGLLSNKKTNGKHLDLAIKRSIKYNVSSNQIKEKRANLHLKKLTFYIFLRILIFRWEKFYQYKVIHIDFTVWVGNVTYDYYIKYL